MRISDWSSDVCSSDLLIDVGVGHDDAMILRAAHGLYALARINAAPVDIMRDVGRTDEADALDIGVVENGVDHFLVAMRSEEHTSELQSLMRISYAVFCLNKKTTTK